MVSGLDKSVCVIYHISFDCTFLSQISILTSPLVPTRHQEHRQSHGTSREPLLENITSDYDLELFRKAQARASDDLVREKTHLHLPPYTLSSSLYFWPYCSSSLLQSADPPLQLQEASDMFLVVWEITSCRSVLGFSSSVLSLCGPFIWNEASLFSNRHTWNITYILILRCCGDTFLYRGKWMTSFSISKQSRLESI